MVAVIVAARRFVRPWLPPMLAIVLAANLGYVAVFSPLTKYGVVLVGKAITVGGYAWTVPLAVLLLIFGIAFNAKLKSLQWKWLEWSLFSSKANMALAPIKYRWVWLPYALLLAFCMPLLAFIEEYLFRYGTTNWLRGLLWGTLAFGLLHLLSFVTVRMAIYLCLVGALFVEVYLLQGLTAVWVLHTMYNLIALSLIIADEKLKGPALKWARHSAWFSAQFPMLISLVERSQRVAEN